MDGIVAERIGGSRQLAATELENINPALAASLIAEHERELRALLVGVLRDPHLVADVLQTTSMKLLNFLQSGTLENGKAWIFRVAMNEALLHKRKRRRESEALRKRNLDEIRHESTESPDQSASRRELTERVAQEVAALPEELRVVVELRIQQGLTFAAVADELQIPLGTALTRMRKALQLLSNTLKHEFP